MTQGKKIFSITELEAMGFPRRMLMQIAHSEQFHEVGFKGERKYHFNLEKLEKFLERNTKWQY